MEQETTQRIATLNDLARAHMGLGCRVMQTRGIAVRPDQPAIVARVKAFDAFTPDNDPHGEHDFGSFEAADGERIFWKFDYYDPSMEYGSEDPSDLLKTCRVLTIMLATEY